MHPQSTTYCHKHTRLEPIVGLARGRGRPKPVPCCDARRDVPASAVCLTHDPFRRHPHILTVELACGAQKDVVMGEAAIEEVGRGNVDRAS